MNRTNLRFARESVMQIFRVVVCTRKFVKYNIYTLNSKCMWNVCYLLLLLLLQWLCMHTMAPTITMHDAHALSLYERCQNIGEKEWIQPNFRQEFSPRFDCTLFALDAQAKKIYRHIYHCEHNEKRDKRRSPGMRFFTFHLCAINMSKADRRNWIVRGRLHVHELL